MKVNQLPKEIRKQLTKDSKRSTALPRFISLRFIEAKRAREMLLDPSMNLDAETRAGLESFYLNKLSWAVGASTGWIVGPLTAGLAGQAFIANFGRTAAPLMLLIALISGYAFYLLVLFWQTNIWLVNR